MQLLAGSAEIAGGVELTAAQVAPRARHVLAPPACGGELRQAAKNERTRRLTAAQAGPRARSVLP
jgi:hypothetical protein